MKLRILFAARIVKWRGSISVSRRLRHSRNTQFRAASWLVNFIYFQIYCVSYMRLRVAPQRTKNRIKLTTKKIGKQKSEPRRTRLTNCCRTCVSALVAAAGGRRMANVEYTNHANAYRSIVFFGYWKFSAHNMYAFGMFWPLNFNGNFLSFELTSNL